MLCILTVKLVIFLCNLTVRLVIFPCNLTVRLVIFALYSYSQVCNLPLYSYSHTSHTSILTVRLVILLCILTVRLVIFLYTHLLSSYHLNKALLVLQYKCVDYKESDVSLFTIQDKCCRYWPAQGSEGYGDLEVTLLHQTMTDAYSESTLSLRSALGGDVSLTSHL